MLFIGCIFPICIDHTVIHVDRPGDVLVSGSNCPVCLELIQIYGSADMVAPWFCNCETESKTKIKLSNRFYINNRQTTMSYVPWMYLQDLRVPKAD